MQQIHAAHASCKRVMHKLGAASIQCDEPVMYTTVVNSICFIKMLESQGCMLTNASLSKFPSKLRWQLRPALTG